jgi:protein SCO1
MMRCCGALAASNFKREASAAFRSRLEQRESIMSAKSRVCLIGVSALFIGALPFFLAPRAAANGPGAGMFPNTELTTQDGKKVHFYDDLIKGKIVAIDLMYTTCQYSCPLETARMAQVQKILGDRVGKDIFFYSISIDPEHDTPEVLKAYMEKFHVGPGWTFLTGKRDDIDRLSKRLGLWAPPSVNKDGHVAYLLIGNEETGQWLRNSAVDNPSFQARMIGDFLDNYKHQKPVEQNSSVDSGPFHLNQGQYVFGRDCIACHTIGHGDQVGPDLLGVTKVRDPQWLARMIQKPNELVAEKDPLATALLKKYNNVQMPNVNVTNEELNYLIAYIEERTAAHEKEAGAGASGTVAKPADGRNGQVPQNK